MPFTAEDLADFSRFAEEQLSCGGVDSIDQLTRDWRETRETAEVVQCVREGEAEYETGGGRPAADVIAEIRQQLNNE